MTKMRVYLWLFKFLTACEKSETLIQQVFQQAILLLQQQCCFLLMKNRMKDVFCVVVVFTNMYRNCEKTRSYLSHAFVLLLTFLLCC